MEFVECECSVDVLDVYCVEIVECVPSGSVDYGYLVEIFALIGMLSMHQVAVWNMSTKWGS